MDLTKNIPRDPEDKIYADNHFGSSFAKSKVTLQDEPCSSRDKIHAAGSIKNLEVGSPICISKIELMKIPSSSLEKELIGLFLHEFAHSLGLEESDALDFQFVFLKNYNKLYPDGLGLLFFKSGTEFNYITSKQPGFSEYRDKITKANNKMLIMKAGVKFKTIQEWAEGWVPIIGIYDAVREMDSYHKTQLSRVAAELLSSGQISEEEIDTKIVRIHNLSENIDELLSILIFDECDERKGITVTKSMQDKVEEIIKASNEVSEIVGDTISRISVLD